MMRIGMLSLALAMIATPLASAHTGVGVTVTQFFLVCGGGGVDTDDLPVVYEPARVVVSNNCSKVYAEYDASGTIQLRCAEIDFRPLLPPFLQSRVLQLETLPDNPPPYGPGEPAPHGCWLAAHLRV